MTASCSLGKLEDRIPICMVAIFYGYTVPGILTVIPDSFVPFTSKDKQVWRLPG